MKKKTVLLVVKRKHDNDYPPPPLVMMTTYKKKTTTSSKDTTRQRLLPPLNDAEEKARLDDIQHSYGGEEAISLSKEATPPHVLQAYCDWICLGQW